MFPVLTVMYVKLARGEERDARAQFGAAYDRYAMEVPGFIPKLGRVLGRAPSSDYHHG
jgi:protein-S-isoprenylcysteine O-methyltransferase Ste14